MTAEATPGALGSNDPLGLVVNRALFADQCQRLVEWALIGPVQRAALESFAERLLAAERERWQRELGECTGALQTVEREAAMWEERARHLGWRDEHGV